MNELILCRSRKYPTLLPHEGQWKFRREGDNFQGGTGWPFEPFLRGLPVKLISKLSVMLLQRVEFDRPGERSPE